MKDYDDNVLKGFIQKHNIKTGDDLNKIFKQMYHDVIQIMLENEMTE